MLKVPPCPDCGNAPVFHHLEYTSSFLNRATRWIEAPGNYIWKYVGPLIGPFIFGVGGVWTIKALNKLGLGRFTDEPTSEDSGRSVVMWEEAKRRGIKIREFHLFNMGGNLFLAKYKNEEISFEGLPRPMYVEGQVPSWMDNKDIMRNKFTKAGIPVAKGDICFSWHHAKKLFDRLQKPVIVKPHVGSRSRHTTTHISTIEELSLGFHKAKVLSPWVLIEEELTGSVFRGTVVGGKTVAVLRRDPPEVTGNGIDTIRTLVETENKKPGRHGKIFHEIAMDTDADLELKRQGLTWESVPASGKLITFNQKVGRGQGAVNVDVTDITHPENKKLLEHAAQVVDDPLVGIDFILGDITKPWNEQERVGILECNGLPFIDLHHYPFEGKPQNVAGALWDIVFPNSNPDKK